MKLDYSIPDREGRIAAVQALDLSNLSATDIAKAADYILWGKISPNSKLPPIELPSR